MIIIIIIKIWMFLGLHMTIQSISSTSSCYAMAITSSSRLSSSSSSTSTTTTLNGKPSSMKRRHLNLYPDNNSDSTVSNPSSSSSCCMDCRSNSTHIVWRQYNNEHNNKNKKNVNNDKNNNEQVQQRNLNSEIDSSNCCCSCIWETINDAKQYAYQYLYNNIMPFDAPFISTLGFHDNNDNTTNNDNIDGLSNGLIGYTIDYAFRTKILFAYTDEYTKDIFYEYVLNYVHMNEPRTNWRPILWNKLVQPLLLSNINSTIENLNVPDVVTLFNTNMWKLLSPNKSSSCSSHDTNTNIEIIFVSGQAPAILDPMSTMIYGYSSCTGLSILLVSALRTAGIPARVVGTAAWYQNRTAGNHNWIEIYYNHTWYFIESKPAALYIDTITNDPCKHWFCNSNRFHYNNDNNTTHVFAARYTRTDINNTTFFPLAWEWSNHNVPGENRTLYYQNICSQCH